MRPYEVSNFFKNLGPVFLGEDQCLQPLFRWIEIINGRTGEYGGTGIFHFFAISKIQSI